jgi:hypothetical protein
VDSLPAAISAEHLGHQQFAAEQVVDGQRGRRALVDGNKRLALAAVIAFYGVNGRRLTLTNDEAYELVIDVATGHLDSVEKITPRLRNATEPRP